MAFLIMHSLSADRAINSGRGGLGWVTCLQKSLRRNSLHEGWCNLFHVLMRVDGGEIIREVEDRGRAVAVLPYDPVRRTALLIKLLRTPVLLAAGVAELRFRPALPMRAIRQKPRGVSSGKRPACNSATSRLWAVSG